MQVAAFTNIQCLLLRTKEPATGHRRRNAKDNYQEEAPAQQINYTTNHNQRFLEMTTNNSGVVICVDFGMTGSGKLRPSDPVTL